MAALDPLQANGVMTSVACNTCKMPFWSVAQFKRDSSDSSDSSEFNGWILNSSIPELSSCCVFFGEHRVSSLRGKALLLERGDASDGTHESTNTRATSLQVSSGRAYCACGAQIGAPLGEEHRTELSCLPGLLADRQTEVPGPDVASERLDSFNGLVLDVGSSEVQLRSVETIARPDVAHSEARTCLPNFTGMHGYTEIVQLTHPHLKELELRFSESICDDSGTVSWAWFSELVHECWDRKRRHSVFKSVLGPSSGSEPRWAVLTPLTLCLLDLELRQAFLNKLMEQELRGCKFNEGFPFATPPLPPHDRRENRPYKGMAMAHGREFRFAATDLKPIAHAVRQAVRGGWDGEVEGAEEPDIQWIREQRDIVQFDLVRDLERRHHYKLVHLRIVPRDANLGSRDAAHEPGVQNDLRVYLDAADEYRTGPWLRKLANALLSPKGDGSPEYRTSWAHLLDASADEGWRTLSDLYPDWGVGPEWRCAIHSLDQQSPCDMTGQLLQRLKELHNPHHSADIPPFATVGKLLYLWHETHHRSFLQKVREHIDTGRTRSEVGLDTSTPRCAGVLGTFLDTAQCVDDDGSRWWRCGGQYQQEPLPHGMKSYLPQVHLMYHGIPDTNTAGSILNDGFLQLCRTDSGWFGQGIYFTHHLEYAAGWYAKHDKGQRHVMVCAVCITNPKAIHDLSYKDKAMEREVDSHVVIVNGQQRHPHPYPESATEMQRPFSEVVVSDPGLILPLALLSLDREGWKAYKGLRRSC